MKLTASETETILAGTLTVTRPVRRRKSTNRAMNCSAKRGELLTVDGQLYRVRGIDRLDEMWHIKLERTESWAIPQEKEWDCVISQADVRRILNGPRPAMLKWPNPCPVKQGETVLLADHGVEVTFGPPTPSKGEDGFTTRIHIADYRAESFLRNSLPSSGKFRKGLRRTDQEEARVDGAYTGVPRLAFESGEHDEGVGANWKDGGVQLRDDRRKAAQIEEEARRRERSVQGELRGLLRGLSPANRLVLLAELEAKMRDTQGARDAA